MVICLEVSSIVVKHLVDNSEGNTESEAALNGANIIVVSKDCDEDKPLINKNIIDDKAPNMILYYDGLKYWPLYETDEDKIIGLFKNTNEIMEKL